MAKNTHVSVNHSAAAVKMQPDQNQSYRFSHQEYILETPPETEEEVLGYLKQYPLLYGTYQSLSPRWKQNFMDFCRGKKSLPLTYDPFFKRIFHPDVHPDRLSRLVSSILGMTVRVVHILPNEDSMIDGSTLLIMDLLGELEDGSLINVEIQKQGYAFPAERISCYSSDLLMRQYARVKGIKGRNFTYQDIKKVYVIVLYEKSTPEFHEVSHAYLHHGKAVFDTGLKIELLQEYLAKVQTGSKSYGKVCCKRAFVCISAFPYDLISGGRPMLLVPDGFRGQEDARLNGYNIFCP